MTIKTAYFSYVCECNICSKEKKDVIGIKNTNNEDVISYETTSIKKADWHLCKDCLGQLRSLDV